MKPSYPPRRWAAKGEVINEKRQKPDDKIQQVKNTVFVKEIAMWKIFI